MNYFRTFFVSLFCLTITQFSFADSPDWVVNSNEYEFQMTMVPLVQINGETTGEAGDLLAAFGQGGVQGLAGPLPVPFGPNAGLFTFDIQIYSNSSGELITFKFYDASADVVVDLDESYVFANGAAFGNMFTPEVLSGTMAAATCDDDSACNTGAEGDCEYPETNFDCDGNCTAEVDCAGECGGDTVDDDCGVCGGDGTSCLSVAISIGAYDAAGGSMEILMESYQSVGGFQLELTGITISSATGGAMVPGDWMVSNSSSTIIGFSLQGTTIAPGSGILAVLEFTPTAEEACFAEVIISDATGSLLDSEFGSCAALDYSVPGCTDEGACNYNPDATEDDGSCSYEEGTCDCDGNPTEDFCDCDGSVLDDCGICGGDGSSCAAVVLSIGTYDSAGGSMEILIENPVEVGGFQFDISGVVINSASAGSVVPGDWMVSNSSTTVIAFSFQGTTIPPGSGVLAIVDFDAVDNEACIANPVVSDADGNGLDVELGGCVAIEGVVWGCTDSSACNYDDSATADDGSCEFDQGCGCGNPAPEQWCVDTDGDGLGNPGSEFDYCVPDRDGDGTLGLSENGDGTWSVDFNSSADIGGFQFDVNGATILSAEGGEAAGNGFMVSTSSTTVIGFSLQGLTIPAGSGTLTNLSLDGTPTSLSGIVVSDAGGVALDFSFDGGDEGVPVADCSDPEPDCGTNDTDCAGDCGGSAEFDDCGECGGDSSLGSDPGDLCDCNGSIVDDCGECGGDGSSCVPVMLSIGAYDAGGGSMEILIENPVEVGGFQFDISGVVINSASAGTVVPGDWMVSNSSTTVIGFSFQGTTIPPGSGVLAIVDFDVVSSEACIANAVVSDAGGSGLDVETGGCVALEADVYGCTDEGSCNYNPDATVDDDSCAVEDCAGECGGSAEVDECGVCGGPGAVYECGCEDIAEGACDCEGNVEDECGVCGGSGIMDPFCDCDDNEIDCAGECGGGAQWDECGVCEGPGQFECDDGSLVCDEAECPEPGGTIDYCLELHSGANLISFYALPEDNSIGNVMASLDGIVTGVIGEGVAANPHPTFGWVGSLSNISAISGYWVKLNQNADLCLTEAIPTDPGIVYNLHFGPNLISFPVDGSVGIGDGLPDDVEGSVTGVIGEGVAASPNPVLGWVGSLTSWQGGKGYWVKVDSPISFAFDLSTLGRSSAIDTQPAELPEGMGVMQSTEQAFYFVEDVLLEGNPIADGDWVLAYNDNVLVGARQWSGSFMDIPAMGYDGSVETAGYSENGDHINFKVLQESSGKIYQVTGATPSWQGNELFSVGVLQSREMPEEMLLVSANPNPFNPVTNVTFGIKLDAQLTVKVFDISGREVAELANGYYLAGYHSVDWQAADQSSGVYFLTVSTADVSHTQKLMLVK